ncbi:hypothetical protein Aperf_G00000124080 [Anoplocephala perfoliata]
MNYSSSEGRLLEVFSHLGMIQRDSSKENEDAVIDLVADIPKSRLLKDISQLTDSFLVMQSLSPVNALNYLRFVTGTLFELVSHPDPDIRMAADEGINQIVKLADIQLVQHVIYEVFLEIKHGFHARSLTSALRKFSASIGRINPKKRRIYAVNILPALNGLLNREEEMVWECFAEAIEPIAIFIFPHTSQQELISLLLKGLLEKVESEKNYIRRSAATILASSVVHSRFPHELSYLLLQHLISRISALKQRFLASTDLATSSSLAACLQGCLWTVRNIASLYSRIPLTALITGRLKSTGRPSPTTYLSAPLVGMETASDFSNWSRESLEFFWWSVVRILCLQLACRNYQLSKNVSSAVMVCSASLECLLEALTSTPAGSIPSELPSGFQSVLGAFCGVKRQTSSRSSSVLHLDGYDSSVEASDADEGSSITSQSGNLSVARVVESGGEIVSLVKRNLLPPSTNDTTRRDNESIANDDPSSPLIKISEDAESEVESGVFATSSMHSWLGVFVQRFGLLPDSTMSARASAQSLAVACLAKLMLILPPEVFFEPLQNVTEAVTGVEIALNLIHHSDPQVRGNACLLIGNLLRSTIICALTNQSVQLDSHLRKEILRLTDSFDDLLSSEKSGVTFRMGLKAIRYCANSVLHLPALVDSATMENEALDASIRLVECLSRHLVDCARHPYRLVRREMLLLVGDLDWDQFEHLERFWFGSYRRGTLKRLVAATPLSQIAWNECLRLLADADRSLGKEAFYALLALAKRTPSVDLKGPGLTNVDLESIDVDAASLFEHSALTGQNAVASELPLIQDDVISDVSGFAADLRCMAKDLPAELHFSTVPIIPFNHSPKSPVSVDRNRRRKWRRQIVGMHRLFRELCDCLFELSPVCDSPENRSMMNSLIAGLAQLLGHAPIMLYHHLWYSPSPIPQPFDIDNSPDNAGIPPARLALQHYQRRPKMALLLWHCISLLAVSPIALTDLILQTQLLYLASGCALRWGVSSLMEGSILAGGTMELYPDHAFTRASIALLNHVIKLLAIFWHVFEGVKPTTSLSAGAILSGLVGSNSAVPIANSPIGSPSTNPPPVVVATSNPANQAKSKSIFGFQFIQTTEVELEESRLVIGSRETRGYFAESGEYMQLYSTVKASFEAFKGNPSANPLIKELCL